MRWRRARSGAFSQRGSALAIAAVLATMIAALVFGSRGLLHLRALRGEEHRVRERITRLLEENEGLRTRLDRIRHDERSLERLAREDLGLVRPGEIVYRFPDRTTAPPR